ncbi:MAG: 4a-hydroxytetrahydrobiopterin dehydratase [Bacteroidota bacterium]
MQKLTPSQIEEQLKSLNGWSHENGSISKTFQFSDFKEAFAVMTRIAFEAEKANHHPEWANVYNRLTINLNTHDAGGITQYDFDLAKTIESLINP